MLTKICGKISALDIFSPEIKLNLKGRESFKTVQGGILMIIITALIMWQVLTLFVSFRKKQNPTF